MSEAERRIISWCRSGYEGFLAREWAEAGLEVREQGPGWVAGVVAGGAEATPPVERLAFAWATIPEATALAGETVAVQATALEAWTGRRFQGVKVEGPWPLVLAAAESPKGLGRRRGAVQELYQRRLKQRMARVARLARGDAIPPPGWSEGVAGFFRSFDAIEVGPRIFGGGQRRMADDPWAPSRSYLKVEEAFHLLGLEPTVGERVVDLGAAPGGWTYAALKRGALVEAVDNGPLKGGAAGHPGVRHCKEDAFRYRPSGDAVPDWLFCDMVEDPRRIIDLLATWVEAGWCRHLVANLKFGRDDPLALIGLLHQCNHPLTSRLRDCKLRHLWHDREELTLVGTTGKRGQSPILALVNAN
ncbi:MAG: rRNA methyltransferase [Puniceicoccaceae bacterium]|nr:MAG: rRNA methyltransferase [Puniceicoccaceae bacterium]